MAVLAADINQTYAMSGATVNTVVDLGQPIIKGSTAKIWLSGDFSPETPDETYTLQIDGVTVYFAQPATGQDAPVNDKVSMDYVGEFMLPDALIGKQNVTITGITSSSVDNGVDPAAYAWIEVWIGGIRFNQKRGYQIDILGNKGRGMYSI